MDSSKQHMEFKNKIPLHQTATETHQNWKKNKNLLFFVKTVILSILLASLKYAYEFTNEYSDGYIIALKEAKKLQNENTKALKKVKKEAKEKQLNSFIAYEKINNKYRESKNNFNKIKTKESANGFKSFHFFVERFGSTTCSFIFSLWVLITFLKKHKEEPIYRLLGKAFMAFVFLLSTIFSYFWIFQKFQDLSKLEYFSMAIIVCCLVTFASYYLFKDRKDYNEIRNKAFIDLAETAIKNADPSKREEMVKYIDNLLKK